jgi:hypothetical protein
MPRFASWPAAAAARHALAAAAALPHIPVRKEAGARALQPGAAEAERTITAAARMRDIRTLASDAFQGRVPGPPHADTTVAWIADQCGRICPKSRTPDGSEFQVGPLVGTTSVPGRVRLTPWHHV